MSGINYGDYIGRNFTIIPRIAFQNSKRVRKYFHECKNFLKRKEKTYMYPQMSCKNIRWEFN